MKKTLSQVHENYMLIRDDEGWKIMHPQHGAILISLESDYEGLFIPKSLKVKQAVVYNDALGDIGILSDVSDIDEAIETLESDGHAHKDIVKMNPRQEKIALFD